MHTSIAADINEPCHEQDDTGSTHTPDVIEYSEDATVISSLDVDVPVDQIPQPEHVAGAVCRVRSLYTCIILKL